jgi:sugar/nucleoside kinase (ribokinase family)
VTPRVLVVGDVVTDVLAVLEEPPAPDTDTPAAIRFTGGGQAANTAAWLADHGVPVTLVAAVGDDEPGAARLAELRAAGVDCPVPPRAGAVTGTVIVVAQGGHRTMLNDRGANLRLTPSDVDGALTADVRHVHLSAYPLLDEASRPAGLRALALARERGLTVSVDAASAAPLRRVGAEAFRDWVRGADLLFANADEASVLGDLAGVVRHVVVKRGDAGADWDGTVRVPARPAVVVDPTGAGDAFAAGLLTAWLAGAGPADALAAGVAAGAVAVARVGARPPS